MSDSSNIIPFNPLERKHLGASVADALLATAAQPLGSVLPFTGAGIYAIYYVGDLACYKPLSDANKGGRLALPIYVGKAIPKGARTGGGAGEVGKDLNKRLREHADSVNAVENLRLDDFFCRFLVVEDIWIPLGESLLIAKFAPVWNSIITGFGNHNPGIGRHAGARPLWDQLHPGRSWAAKLVNQTISANQLAEQAEDYLRSITIPTSPFVESDPIMPLSPAGKPEGRS